MIGLDHMTVVIGKNASLSCNSKCTVISAHIMLLWLLWSYGFPLLAKWHSRYIWSGILFLKRKLIMEQVVDTPENNILIMS